MSLAHIASVRIDAPAEFVFACLTDAARLGRWTLGSMDYRPTDLPGVHRGVSLFDGSEAIVEIRPYRDLWLIDYHVGSLAERQPRVSIRLAPGAEWGLPEHVSMAAMSTWRAGWMDEERWQRTRTTHELEVFLFKAQIEAEWEEREE